MSISFATDQMMAMRHFDVGAGLPSFVARAISASGDPIRLHWFDADVQYAGLGDADASALSDLQGRADLEFSPQHTGKGLLVVSRDPKDGTAATTVDLGLDLANGDWALVESSGWENAVTPLPDDSGSRTSVPSPEILHGDVASTYLNFSILNQSTEESASTTAHIHVDDTLLLSQGIDPLAPGAFSLNNLNEPVTIPGGRHVLWVEVDPDGRTGEVNEANNVFARQWVFQPGVVGLDTATERPMPASPTTGLQFIGLEEGGEDVGDENHQPTYPDFALNCDGLRTPDFSSMEARPAFAAFAVMPPDTLNVDLQLFEASTGAQDGFVDPLAVSSERPGRSDFVVVDFARTAPRAFDLGIYGPDGSGDVGLPPAGTTTGRRAPDAQYHAQLVGSVDLGRNPEGAVGPFTMDNAELLDLYAVTLSPTGLTLRLTPADATIDYGLAVMALEDFTAKHEVHLDALADDGGPGAIEELSTLIAHEDVYAVAVFKQSSQHTTEAGSYRLEFAYDTTATPPGLPGTSVFELASPSPNPFTATTEVAWTLRRGAHVRLEIFDVRGRLVRTLLDGERAAGHHLLSWNGRDDGGRDVGQGTYFLRATAAGVSTGHKLLLVR